MPLLTIERKDLSKLLKGETIQPPQTGLRVVIDDELITELAPIPELTADLIAYLDS